jgi:4-hydroxy-tetrahydrodipicolinate reductase
MHISSGVLFLRILLIGYGRMGKAIKDIALKRSHEVISVDPIDPSADFRELNSDSIKGVDVCIDFSSPDFALSNAKIVSNFKKNLVMGTTGWYDKIDEMKNVTKEIGFLWSGNFSIGMNVFFHSVKETAKLMNNLPDYDVAVSEIHHNQKKDSPSGSAQMIGKIILEYIKRKTKLVSNCFSDRKPEPFELHVSSMRCGNVPGTHAVLFDSLVDSIELKHTARGREGFALGSVLAAEFIFNKKGFFTIDDLMKTINRGN